MVIIMKINVYDYLSEDAMMIRKQVFMDEQGFENEIDDTDRIASHIVMYNDNDEPIATCRVFEESENNYILGRLAVVKSYRGMNIGERMVREAEKLVMEKGGTLIMLHSQCRVKGFYEKSGYAPFGEIGYDEGCPHIWMKKQL